jgi:hypothetical protein
MRAYIFQPSRAALSAKMRRLPMEAAKKTELGGHTGKGKEAGANQEFSTDNGPFDLKRKKQTNIKKQSNHSSRTANGNRRAAQNQTARDCSML